MADDIIYTSSSPAGPPNATKQVTDEHVTRGHMPIVKLAYSADGDATPVPADVTGLQTKNIVASQADGHSANIGTLADADTTLTLTGLLKKLKALLAGGLPAALGANGGLKIEGVASGTVVPISGTVTASNTAGDIAHDGVNSGNPVQIAVEAIAHGTNPTAVAAADRTKLYANRAGIPFVIGGHPNIKTVRQTFTTGITDDSTMTGTIAAGTKVVVTQLMVTMDNANTVFPSVLIGFGATNTPTTTGVLASHPGVPAGGGFSRGDGSGMLGVGADGEEVRVTTVGTVTAGHIVMSYYTIES